MACCGKRVRPGNSLPLTPDQQVIVNNIKRNNIGNSPVKSNRNVPGTPLVTCPGCGTRSVFNLCPVCGNKTIK